MVGVFRREDLPRREPRPVTLALWRMADPGNVGTLIRTADAFGAAVALSEGCADPTGPEGAARVGGLDLARAAAAVRRRRRAGASRSSRAAASRSARSTWAARRPSSSAPSARACRTTVERDAEAWIPIGGAESLNAAVAGAIALYEWRRQ